MGMRGCRFTLTAYPLRTQCPSVWLSVPPATNPRPSAHSTSAFSAPSAVNSRMNLPEVQVTFQAISSLAIAGGLLYSAFQFRQYRRAQHFANFTKLVEAQMHLREMRVTDPALAEVYRDDVTHAESDPPLSPADRERAIREYFFNLMQLSVFEIVWYGHHHGQIPADYFKSWESRMRQIVVERSFRQMWASPSMKIMHDQFQRYMMELVRTTPEKPRVN